MSTVLGIDIGGSGVKGAPELVAAAYDALLAALRRDDARLGPELVR